MGDFSFRSVGTTAERATAEARAVQPPRMPVGIKTPLEHGDGDGIFKMHYDLVSTTQDNFRNLLLTNHGERLGLYDYGANLRKSLSEWVSIDSFDAVAFENISAAVTRWMPYIALKDYSSRLVDGESNASTVIIRVNYEIPALGATDKSIEVALRVL